MEEQESPQILDPVAGSSLELIVSEGYNGSVYARPSYSRPLSLTAMKYKVSEERNTQEEAKCMN